MLLQERLSVAAVQVRVCPDVHPTPPKADTPVTPDLKSNMLTNAGAQADPFQRRACPFVVGVVALTLLP